MRLNIAVLAHIKTAEQTTIQDQLARRRAWNVKNFSSLDEVNRGLSAFQAHLLLIRLPHITTAQLPFLKKVRARFPQPGLIVISREIDPASRFQFREVVRHRLILDPLELADLPAVIAKLTAGETGPTRLHPRISRQDDCEILQTATGARSQARFVDFAQMGARLVVQSRSPLEKNHRVQLNYRSTSDPDRVHRIQSNVIWVENRSSIIDTVFGRRLGEKEQLVGLRFVAAL